MHSVVVSFEVKPNVTCLCRVARVRWDDLVIVNGGDSILRGAYYMGFTSYGWGEGWMTSLTHRVNPCKLSCFVPCLEGSLPMLLMSAFFRCYCWCCCVYRTHVSGRRQRNGGVDVTTRVGHREDQQRCQLSCQHIVQVHDCVCSCASIFFSLPSIVMFRRTLYFSFVVDVFSTAGTCRWFGGDDVS